MPSPLVHRPPPDLESGSLRLASDAPRHDGMASGADRLRTAAQALDRASGAPADIDATRAMRLWEGLVRGSSELIDWFDADGRRFIIARLRPETDGARRGLTNRERQVALGAALGESSKLTGYRLGISPSRVSALLNSAMRKLGVQTKVQLVVMVRLLRSGPLGAKSAPETVTRNV